MSIQGEIDRIKKNVDDTLQIIKDTGVSTGEGSDALPAAAQALANEKQDKASAVTVPGGGSMEMAESLGSGPYTIEITEDDDDGLPASGALPLTGGTLTGNLGIADGSVILFGELPDLSGSIAIDSTGAVDIWGKNGVSLSSPVLLSMRSDLTPTQDNELVSKKYLLEVADETVARAVAEAKRDESATTYPATPLLEDDIATEVLPLHLFRKEDRVHGFGILNFSQTIPEPTPKMIYFCAQMSSLGYPIYPIYRIDNNPFSIISMQYNEVRSIGTAYYLVSGKTTGVYIDENTIYLGEAIAQDTAFININFDTWQLN